MNTAMLIRLYEASFWSDAISISYRKVEMEKIQREGTPIYVNAYHIVSTEADCRADKQKRQRKQDKEESERGKRSDALYFGNQKTDSQQLQKLSGVA